jgi:hypothetical protein
MSPIKRLKVLMLEGNTISYINLPTHLSDIYNVNDTVWVDMEHHCIDDTGRYTMKCVIIPTTNIEYYINVSGGIDSNNVYSLYDNTGVLISNNFEANKLDSIINADNE